MNSNLTSIKVVVAIFVGVMLNPIVSYGVESGASLTLVGGDPNKGVLDPEDHTKIVDPGEIISTKGPLRLDYVPSFDFGKTRVSRKTMAAKADAQLLHQGSGPRANFIQVSDYRNTQAGWSLLVRQEHQFRDDTKANSSLKGATLSFDKAWSYSSLGQAYAPSVSKETIVMNNIGDTYPLAEAEPGKGMGTWSISFGASETNPLKQANTLSVKRGKDNKIETNPSFENQKIYENDAIQLTIPASTAIQAGNYSTVLTWIIAELP